MTCCAFLSFITLKSDHVHMQCFCRMLFSKFVNTELQIDALLLANAFKVGCPSLALHPLARAYLYDVHVKSKVRVQVSV